MIFYRLKWAFMNLICKETKSLGCSNPSPPHNIIDPSKNTGSSKRFCKQQSFPLAQTRLLDSFELRLNTLVSSYNKTRFQSLIQFMCSLATGNSGERWRKSWAFYFPILHSIHSKHLVLKVTCTKFRTILLWSSTVTVQFNQKFRCTTKWSFSNSLDINYIVLGIYFINERTFLWFIFS